MVSDDIFTFLKSLNSCMVVFLEQVVSARVQGIGRNVVFLTRSGVMYVSYRRPKETMNMTFFFLIFFLSKTFI